MNFHKKKVGTAWLQRADLRTSSSEHDWSGDRSAGKSVTHSGFPGEDKFDYGFHPYGAGKLRSD